jgi:hypothetical protein
MTGRVRIGAVARGAGMTGRVRTGAVAAVPA